MANGQQVSEQNIAAFIAWSSSKSDEDFREYVHRGVLKRSEIASECGFGKSALVQNPSIKKALEDLENGLRMRNVLPTINAASPAAEPVMPDREAKQRQRDSHRLNALEQENAALRAELNKAKAMLVRYKLLSSFIEETGRLPR